MGSVFLPAQAANSLLRRFRRANSALEEIKQGNIQRECRDESCSYEEAREAFENDEKTRRFWDEYVRENSPNGSGGLESGIGQFQSLYLIIPLLVGLLLLGVVIAVWRCHSHKLFQRRSGFANGGRDPNPAFVAMDRQGRSYRHTSELSAQNSPARPGSDVTPGQMSSGDPPPSYEEAMGHTEAPPQYEDIINTRSTRVIIGRGK